MVGLTRLGYWLFGTFKNNDPNNKINPNFVYNLQTMSIGYLIPENSASIWRGPMVIKVITQFLRDVEWNNLDFLIVDLPPGTGDVQLTLAQKLDLKILIHIQEYLRKNILMIYPQYNFQH